MIGCIVQTRMGSTRLPGKVLEKLDSNYTMLEYVLKQLSHSKHIEKIVVATTINPEDDKIEHLVRSLDVNVFIAPAPILLLICNFLILFPRKIRTLNKWRGHPGNLD